jgi:hypothetical protein
MTDWVPLREFLQADIGRQLDEIILNDPDPEARAVLLWHRERVLNMLTDRAELITLHRLLAEREERAPAASVGPLKLNGHRGHA